MAEAAEMDVMNGDSKDIRAKVALVYEEHVGKIAHDLCPCPLLGLGLFRLQ